MLGFTVVSVVVDFVVVNVEEVGVVLYERKARKRERKLAFTVASSTSGGDQSDSVQ